MTKVSPQGFSKIPVTPREVLDYSLQQVLYIFIAKLRDSINQDLYAGLVSWNTWPRNNARTLSAQHSRPPSDQLLTLFLNSHY